MRYLIYLFPAVMLIVSGQVLAQVKICKIKYGLVGIEKRNFDQSLLRKNNNNYPNKCRQIGLEHDEFRRPIPGKPIYACCTEVKVRDTTLDNLFETE